MTLPPTITLKIDCQGIGDLSGLIFEMRVTSGTKNFFHIYFPKTAADGMTRITAEDFRGQFNDHYDTGLMDYNGSVEIAEDIVAIKLFDPLPMMQHRVDLLRWPLFTHERKVWRSRQAFIDYFLSCRNREFNLFEPWIHIPADGMIRLMIDRKVHAT